MYSAILWICTVIALAVFGVMLYSIASFRGVQNTPTTFHRRSAIEIIWALIPIAIFIGAAWPAVKMIGPSEIRIAESAVSAGPTIAR